MANWVRLRVERGIEGVPEWINLDAAFHLTAPGLFPGSTDIHFTDRSIRVLHPLDEVVSLVGGRPHA